MTDDVRQLYHISCTNKPQIYNKHKQKVIKNVEVTLTKHGKQSGPRNGHIKFEKLGHVTQSRAHVGGRRSRLVAAHFALY